MKHAHLLRAGLLAVGAAMWVNVGLADEAHQHGAAAKTPAAQVLSAPSGTPPATAPAQEPDLLKTLENMPALDHDSCCSLNKSKTGHDHGH